MTKPLQRSSYRGLVEQRHVLVGIIRANLFESDRRPEYETVHVKISDINQLTRVLKPDIKWHDKLDYDTGNAISEAHNFYTGPNSREIDIYYVDKYRKISIKLSFLQSQEVHVIIGRISAQVWLYCRDMIWDWLY